MAEDQGSGPAPDVVGKGFHALLSAALLVIVIAGLKASTTLVVPLGKTLVLVNRPHEPFDSSALFPAAKPAPPTITLLLIHAEGAALSTK